MQYIPYIKLLTRLQYEGICLKEKASHILPKEGLSVPSLLKALLDLYSFPNQTWL